MSAPVGKLGDPFASREITVQKMLGVIGRDVSDLTFTPADVGDSAALPDDPDVHLAWDALAEAYSDALTRFRLFNTYRKKITPGPSGAYQIPISPGPAHGVGWDPDLYTSTGSSANLIAAVRVLHQPPDLNLVWRGTTSATNTALVDTVTGTIGDFTGKGEVIVDVAYFLPWEQIPLPVRKYIFTSACRRFIQRAVGATDYIGYTAQDEQTALALAMQYDLEQAPANILLGSGSGEREPGLIGHILDRWPY